MKWEIYPVTGTLALLTGINYYGGPLPWECNFSFQLLEQFVMPIHIYTYMHVYAIYNDVFCVSLCLEKKSKQKLQLANVIMMCLFCVLCAKRLLHLLIF